MELTEVLRSILEVSVIMPIGIMCLITFYNKLKIQASFAFGIHIGFFSVLSIIGGFLRVKYSLNINFIMFIMAVLLFIYILTIIRENRQKILYILASACALVSSTILFGYLLEASHDMDKTFYEAQTWGLVLRFGLIVLLFITFIILLPKIRWLINCPDLSKIWKVMWIVPFTFALSNLIMIPHYFIYLSMDRATGVYITVGIVLLLMHMLFMFMLYYIAKTITEKSKLDKQAQMLSVQASQYESLQRHIEATSKLRHDFKHTVRTAVSLAKEGNNEALLKLLTDYGVATESTEKRSVFTKNSSLNALISYYYDQALSLNIHCDWQVRLPEKIGVEDIDLYGIIGNLLENAIHAAQTEEAENRYINLKADVEENGDIYIVATNGFSGELKKDHDRYLSTKKDGSGIGIESIKSTVKRYNGFVSFYNDPKTFYADIMLRQNSQ